MADAEAIISAVQPSKKLPDQVYTHLDRAREYSRHGDWQDALREWKDAEIICSQDGSPEATRKRMQILHKIGSQLRAIGQYDKAQPYLVASLECDNSIDKLWSCDALDELGTMRLHNDDFEGAQLIIWEQQRIVEAAEQEVLYHKWNVASAQATIDYYYYLQFLAADSPALKSAKEQFTNSRAIISQMERSYERNGTYGTRRQHLIRRLQAHTVERLAFCAIQQNQTVDGVSLAKEAMRYKTGDNSSSLARCRFFLGYALYAHGLREEAFRAWNCSPGTCTPVIALCEEPTLETYRYLRILIDSGLEEVDLESYDEQGLGALDYLAASNTAYTKAMVTMMENGIVKRFLARHKRQRPLESNELAMTKAEAYVSSLDRQTRVRCLYRLIFQDTVRPSLLRADGNSIRLLRHRLCEDMASQPKPLLEGLHFVDYSAFLRHQRLPSWSDRLTRKYIREPLHGGQHILFISYRWIGRENDPPVDGPDDDHDSQWKRVKDAVEAYLDTHPTIARQSLRIWLDYACIRQNQREQKERGIATLPLAMIQCDAMISIVDDEYYKRAWCVVEATLMHRLREVFRVHEWWHYEGFDSRHPGAQGRLVTATLPANINLDKLELTNEAEDRPMITFLLRQSKLLG